MSPPRSSGHAKLRDRDVELAPEDRRLVLHVVFDTNTVVSALLFASGGLAWLRQHWREGGSIPLVSRATAAELTRVLSYPKFRLSPADRIELLGDYLPYCETIKLFGEMPNCVPGHKRSTVSRSCSERQRRSAGHRQPGPSRINRSKHLF